MTLRIGNQDARRIWLHLQGMAAPPSGALTRLGLAALIERLGMVQLDPLRVIARAHDHILWSRSTGYRPHMLEKLLGKDRAIFEHYTHDAAVLPMAVWPLWQRQRDRFAAKASRGSWSKHLPPQDNLAAIRDRIACEGPLCSRDFEGRGDKSIDAWMPAPHKLALDHLWRVGELATAHRRNFSKFYDLTERVIPEAIRADRRSSEQQLDWLCRAALARLGFSTVNEIKSFYDAADLMDIKAQTGRGDWCRPVEIETADGSWMPALAIPGIGEILREAPEPSRRLRIVNPFDPIVRDRTRANRLFGFDYRIEIYTPAAKRQYGYYVYPLLEGDRFVGRMEARLDNGTGILAVEKLWPERGIRFGKGRMAKLETELDRLGRFAGAEEIRIGI